MEKILEKYESYSYAEKKHTTTVESPVPLNLENAKLKARLEVLQRNQRHYMGEDLDSVSLKQLQNLEHQIDVSLKHIRSRKNQLMHESISEHQKKVKAFQAQNSTLMKKVKEKEKELAQTSQLEQQNHAMNSSSFGLPQRFDVSEICQAMGHDGEFEASRQRQSSNTVIPPWMLHHIHGLI